MSAILQHLNPAPFDAIADRYDEAFTQSKIGLAQREAVWSELARTFHSGDRVLEIGCGTGVDACFLAKRGVHVTACDPSARMIEVATRRVRDHKVQDLVELHILRAEAICTVSKAASFDGAFSNFGALNCVDDLDQLARGLARLLLPGANALLCWMGPYCLWEMLWYVTRGDREKAFRRLQSAGVTARIAEGASIHVRYPSVTLLRRAFFPEFRVDLVKGIGVAVPPSYVESWARRHPRLLRFLQTCDSQISQWPGVRQLGDHVLVRLQRVRSDRDVVAA